MNDISCNTNYTLIEILKGIQVTSVGTNVPAFQVIAKTYTRELTTAIMEANHSYEDYLRLCVKTGGSGTLKLNICFLDCEALEPLQNCTGAKDSIAPMFCITSDGEVALKLAYVS